MIPAELPAQCLSLEELARAQGATVQIVSGGEVDLMWALNASDAQLACVALDGLGRDLLIETPMDPTAPGAEEALFDLVVRGFRITLAHPELSSAYQREPWRLHDLVDRGVLLQVTGSAMLRPARRSASGALAQSLVRDGFVCALASDAHSGGPWRPPELRRAVLAAARFCTPARAEWLVLDGPDAILAGEPIPPLPHARATPRGRAWLRRHVRV